ncbi:MULTISPECIES: response regulator transcription factor [Rhizobium/Agrobacterium group]|jgi:FixJ family two-component response regulator|uniref:LuxR family two component transcriptional regulator n=1 Tax=Neorhizobium alkalisoli TaxID=528178 RepID=A0A561QCB2_9HYPH|nr:MULTISPECIES: response regulator [Rhizobium/Agrobacterium group]TWF48019.1 LuxR family two component transcriptional regulator [Neorhizobium alkalisoli]
MSAAAGNRAHDANATKADAPLVVVVDDDDGMRDGLRDVLSSVGIDSLGFSSTAELLAEPLPDRPGCLILDVRLPGLSGLDLQAKLNGMGNKLPIVFMTGYADVPMSVRAMKAGATDFLSKPFRDQEMLDAVSVAIERDRARRLELSAANEALKAAASLTPREHEVMEAVVKGLLNKQIAHLLDISEVTVKIHRGNVMRKMNVASLADLVRKVGVLNSLA